MATTYKFTDEQFQQIQSALDAASGMALRFDQSMLNAFNAASCMMDDVANEEGELKPFSTYPEERERLLALATVLQMPHDVETGEQTADQLSDLVLAILSDEATDVFDKDDGPTAA